ncbi:YcaO-like family protein, partial [Rhizobium leguminosarum]|uniref:YcaO-like family protein n=1 Tax=Rhizobium leguminosarum TaxID=384 RepID=UPI003F975354
GFGCHPDPVRAALRAITEAAQSRLTSIAGSRDDFSPRIYQRLDTVGKVAWHDDGQKSGNADIRRHIEQQQFHAGAGNPV